jgi:hypothetical protein
VPRTTRGSDRAAALLVKAIRQLPEGEQDVVLRHLVAAGIAAGSQGQAAPAAPGGPYFIEPEPWSPLAGGMGPGPRGSQFPGNAQVVPVRLPESQYRRLKDWCQGHSFAMAVVIRGLVDQFLERQGARPAAEAAAVEPGS